MIGAETAAAGAGAGAVVVVACLRARGRAPSSSAAVVAVVAGGAAVTTVVEVVVDVDDEVVDAGAELSASTSLEPALSTEEMRQSPTATSAITVATRRPFSSRSSGVTWRSRRFIPRIASSLPVDLSHCHLERSAVSEFHRCDAFRPRGGTSCGFVFARSA